MRSCCVALVFGLVRIEVTEEALLAEEALLEAGSGALAIGDACGGGRGECTAARACETSVPRLQLEAWSLPSVAWCFSGLTCCATKTPHWNGRLKFSDGSTEPLPVHKYMSVDEIYGVVDEIIARKGDMYDYRLTNPLSLWGGALDRGDATTLFDLRILFPHQFDLSVDGRLLGGIANGVESSWAEVPFVVKLRAEFEEIDAEGKHGPAGRLLKFASTCSGALIGKYVFSAAHCFQGAKATADKWTVLAFNPAATGAFVVGQTVLVWDRDRAGAHDAIVTEVTLFGAKASPIGWPSPDGYSWNHMEHTAQIAMPVREIWNNDLYDPEVDAYDFAIMEVELPAGYTPPQPPMLDDALTELNRPVLFAGYGEREDGASGELRTATLETTRCATYEIRGLNTVRCAHSGPQSAVTTCVGDSGGPVFYPVASREGSRDEKKAATRVALGEQYVLTAANSFGYLGDCGDTAKKTGVNMVKSNKAFILATIPAQEQARWLNWL